MVDPSFELKVGQTYRINPEMVAGLPSFLGIYEEEVHWSGIQGQKTYAEKFKLLTKILGYDNPTVILRRAEIRSIEEVAS